MPEQMVQKAVLGAAVLGAVGAILWLIEKIRVQIGPANTPNMSREEMIAGLEGIADDPNLSAYHRRRASRRLAMLHGIRYNRKERRDMPRLARPTRRIMVWTAVGVGWLIFCVASYVIANDRAEECRHVVWAGAQQDICIRHAIESRDSVLAWGVGLPLFIAIAAALTIEYVRLKRDL